MGFWKFSPFLAFSILVLCHISSLQAAPFRSASDSSPDLASLSEEEARLLLAALVQDYVRMKAGELEQETEDSSLDSLRSKQCDNLSTCMLGTYWQNPSRVPAFFSSETPGKKRDLARGLQKNGYLQLSITAQKRACNTATCVTHRLAGLLSRSGGVVKDNFVPTNVGSNAFGRRRRDLQA